MMTMMTLGGRTFGYKNTLRLPRLLTMLLRVCEAVAALPRAIALEMQQSDSCGGGGACGNVLCGFNQVATATFAAHEAENR